MKAKCGFELRRNTTEPELQTIATYYFDGQGKALRPMVGMLMARAINYHIGLSASQRQVAMISEMIHSASLIHDDVVDQADCRRGKPSVNVLWNHKKTEKVAGGISSSKIKARLTKEHVRRVLLISNTT
ncbi:hypothetical protein Cfor_12543 [Coptotermes formosanus]|uniref:Polyprenyl synthetase n=1 Tax=Coptotermes formosanus TaxID=36987 RepID=A0A6L2PGY3_COPFO|nr:hypothetical protein Cfor_12543 [Coptotermes formosanus]